ncbi:MAG: glycerol-3-phosphate dehydrogenase subunit GlpB [Desulfobacterales bacterium]|nr:glycerol-3-phosphate dehydrogenase subunit GlpB [Desulfobacterales bacterium]
MPVAMMPEETTVECNLAIIGCGLSGMAAALFAAGKGFSTVQTGVSGGMIFASGLLDLMCVHPVEKGSRWMDPWAAIDALSDDIPEHPYARLKKETIKKALEKVVYFLRDNGLPYLKCGENNSEVMTPLGTSKHTYYVPQTMWEGVRAFKEKRPCLVVGFRELNDFSAAQIAGALGERWPGLRWQDVSLQGSATTAGLVSGDIMARDMELAGNLEKVVTEIRPHIRDAETVGIPAILGMERSHEIVERLSQELGARVFEIPTMPLSVPGLRLNEAFTRGLSDKGVKLFFPNRIISWEEADDGNFLLGIGQGAPAKWIRAEGVILATGRFWARGLRADRDRIREALFDLPVHQPEERAEWHHEDFLDLRGHPVNRAGLEVDDLFRPLDRTGGPASEKLFAAGSILAHQDWMRMKCGSGLAVSSAYAAVTAFSKIRG